MLELKELAEVREAGTLEKAKEERKLLKAKEYKLLRKQRIKELNNLRYREENEEYLRNLEAKKAYINLLN